MTSELELRVIGTLLRHPEALPTLDLKGEHFALPMCLTALEAMRGLMAEGRKIDPFAVADRMLNPAALADLLDLWREAIGHADNLPFWCEKLRKEARGRALARLLEKAGKALLEGKDSDRVRAHLLERMTALDAVEARYEHGGTPWMAEVVDYLEGVFQARRNGGLAGVPTGLTGLDTLLGGFHKADLAIVAARPKIGKTALMMSQAAAAAAAGYRVGIVSAEMPAVQLGQRLVGLVGRIAGAKLRICELDDQEYARLTEATTRIQHWPIRVYDKPACTPGDIALQAQAWAQGDGLDILFVDYLTRLQPDRREESRTRDVGRMAQSLKTLANSLQIPVVCLAQLSRAVEQRPNKRPMLSDLRDSGEIEQEADTVMFLYREHVYNDQADPELAEVIVEANRHGPPGTVPARFVGEHMRWTERVTVEEAGW